MADSNLRIAYETHDGVRALIDCLVHSLEVDLDVRVAIVAPCGAIHSDSTASSPSGSPQFGQRS